MPRLSKNDSEKLMKIVTSTITDKPLKDYYFEKYGEPDDDSQAINILVEAFKEQMSYNVVPPDINEGISEYYRIIKSRNLPAFEWILEAIHVASKKNVDKKNFHYIVGILRSWLRFGFGHIPNREEDDIVDFFEEIIGFKSTVEARGIINNLMGTYGVVKIARIMHEMKKEDTSYAMTLILKEKMFKKFG